MTEQTLNSLLEIIENDLIPPPLRNCPSKKFQEGFNLCRDKMLEKIGDIRSEFQRQEEKGGSQ